MTYCEPADVYRKSGLDASSGVTEADIIEHIKDAESEIDELYDMNFNSGNVKEEWFDTYDEPNITISNGAINTIFLSKIPVIGLTSMQSFDTSNVMVKDWDDSEYWLDKDIGEVRLIDGYFVGQRHRIKVVYEWGYGTVPRIIKNLATVIAAMNALKQKIGTTYDDVTSYTLPGVSVGVGEPYMNMVKAMDKLKDERKMIEEEIGRLKSNSVVV